MNATINAPCPHGCPWPARECTRHDGGAAYVSPILLLGGIAVAGYACLGISTLLLVRLAWDAIHAHLGG